MDIAVSIWRIFKCFCWIFQGSRSFLANGVTNGLVNPVPTSSQQQSLNNNLVFENGCVNGGGLLSKRFSSPSTSLGPLGGLGSGSHCSDLSTNGVNVTGSSLNPYEKWSNGSDKLFDQHTSDSILELSSKLLTLGHPSGPISSSSLGGTPMGNSGCNPNVSSLNNGGFPPKSQIKRQKMVYHCKFGEFGVLEGQFTEPSGVAVNAQNDIVVADTNNHRIQIFDKEGRFKFQFGECGKRDGQLLYPNRVAVVRSSGDIIVTERSPTHQVIWPFLRPLMRQSKQKYIKNHNKYTLFIYNVKLQLGRKSLSLLTSK